MKFGVEEEFLVIDPNTLFYTPGAIRLVNALIYKNFNYLKKSNIELPLNSNMLKRPLSDLKKAFSVIEIKTDPTDDIEQLKAELDFHRKNLVKVSEENKLILIPAGIHPLYTFKNTLPDNCASLHIHIDNESKKIYHRLLSMIPFLISISTNSPFYGGNIKAMSTRALLSPHMGPPNNRYSRNSDLIINKSLNTIEIRALDTQITSDYCLGLVEIVNEIVKNDIFDGKISRRKYIQDRKIAIQNGRGSVKIDEGQYEVLKNCGEYASSVFESANGSDWQIAISNNKNLGSVIMSLWHSFKKNKRDIKLCSKEVVEDIKWTNLMVFLTYSPFFFIEKFNKFRQDYIYADEFKNESEKLFIEDSIF